jgi:hypothetical protein
VNNCSTVAAAQKANRLANKPINKSSNDEASSDEAGGNEPVRQQPAQKCKQVA